MNVSIGYYLLGLTKRPALIKLITVKENFNGYGLHPIFTFI
jgi:hypothetical protein